MADLRLAVRQACQQVSCHHVRVKTLPTGADVCNLVSLFVIIKINNRTSPRIVN